MESWSRGLRGLRGLSACTSVGPSASLFFFGLFALLLESVFFDGFGDSSFLSLAWRDECSEDDFLESIEALVAVGALGATCVAVDEDFVVVGESLAGECAQAIACGVIHIVEIGDCDA